MSLQEYFYTRNTHVLISCKKIEKTFDKLLEEQCANNVNAR
jgi:hypothetical protein